MREHMDINYFIEILSGIPYEDWTLTTDKEPNDVWEWLKPDEGRVLLALVQKYGALIDVNDGVGMWSRFGSNPKMRVVKFLNEVKKSLDKAA